MKQIFYWGILRLYKRIRLEKIMKLFVGKHRRLKGSPTEYNWGIENSK